MGFNLCCFCVTGPVNTLDPAAQIVAYESTKKLQEDFAEGRKLGEKKQCLRLEVAIETPRDFYVLTDVCAGGELMKHLERCDQFVEQDASRFFAHFCGAVAHCHANQISHRASRCPTPSTRRRPRNGV